MTPKGIGLEHIAHGGHGGGFECAEQADAGVIDQDVDGAGSLKRPCDAVGAGHVQRKHAQAVRRRQQVFARCAQGGDDFPALRQEVTGRGKAIARGTAGDQYGFHGTLQSLS